MEPSGATRKPRADKPSHAWTQFNSMKEPSGGPKNTRKNVANQRNNATIVPAPETLQEFLRQDAAEDAAQRDNQRCTHHDSRDQKINTHRDLLNQQEEGCSSARRTTKPGTEGELKRRIAVRPETVRVNIGYPRVVVELEPTHSPRTLGNDDRNIDFLHEIQHQQITNPGARDNAT